MPTAKQFNPFIPNAPFLYHRKPYGSLMLSGGREMMHWEKRVNWCLEKRHEIFFELRPKNDLFFNLSFEETFDACQWKID